VRKERGLDEKLAAAETPEELVAVMVNEFARDIAEWSARTKRGAVVFLDRFEVFEKVAASGGGSPLSWLEPLLDASGLMLVMFGQRELHLGNKLLTEVDLLPFVEAEWNEYLDLAGVDDPAVRGAMIELSGGLPFGLATAVDIELRRPGTLAKRDFRLEAKEAERIYQTLASSADENQRELLALFSVPRTFTREILELMRKEDFTRIADRTFDKFVRESFIEPLGHGRWTIHTLLRTVALAELRGDNPDRHCKVESALSAFYRRKASSTEPINEDVFRWFSEALYHAAQAGAGDGFAEWLFEVDRLLRYAGGYSWLETTYRRTLEIDALSPVAKAALTILLGGCRLKWRGEKEAADLVAAGYQQMVELRPDSLLHSFAALERGEAAQVQGGSPQALSFAQEALRLFKNAGHATGIALATSNIGFYNGRLGNDRERLTCYRQATTYARERNLLDLDIFQNNLGEALAATGDLDAALRLHQQNLELRKNKGRRSGMAVTLAKIAQIHLWRGDFDEALARNAEAKKLNQEMQRLRKVFECERLEAIVSLLRNDIEAARTTLAATLAAVRRVNNSDDVVETLYWVARAHIAAGDMNAVEKAINEATARLKNSSSRRLEADLVAARGKLAMRANPQQAVKHFREALTGKTFLHISNRCDALCDYAAALDAIGLRAEARAALGQAVAISEVLGLFGVRERREAFARIGDVPPDDSWPAPDEVIEKVDKEYDRLARLSDTAPLEMPNNREAEKLRVKTAYESNNEYEPQFTYPDVPPLPVPEWIGLFTRLNLATPLHRLYNDLVRQQLRAIHRVRSHDPEAISLSTADAYGEPDVDLVNVASVIVAQPSPVVTQAATLTADDARNAVVARLAELGIGWTVEVSATPLARLTTDALKRRVMIRSDARWTQTELAALIAHEIETHVFRAENGARQPLTIFATGLPGYLEAEEGLAVWSELGSYNGRVPTRVALRVLASNWARNDGFFRVFHECADTTRDVDMSFDVAARVKRGFLDASAKGAHMKDIVYLRGALHVRDVIEAPDADEKWRALYAGKVGMRHVAAVRAAIKDGWLKPAALVPKLPAVKLDVRTKVGDD